MVVSFFKFTEVLWIIKHTHYPAWAHPNPLKKAEVEIHLSWEHLLQNLYWEVCILLIAVQMVLLLHTSVINFASIFKWANAYKGNNYY